MGERVGLVECPRCHKLWRLPWASSGTECWCHLYCSSGTKPSDCSVPYPYNWSGQLGAFTGAHNDAKNEGDNIFQRGGYCATHNKYTNKEMIWLEVDWKRFEKQRLPANLRMLKQ